MNSSRTKQKETITVDASFKDLTSPSLLSKAILLVSVGQQKCEGDYLKATLALLDASHRRYGQFKSIDVLVAGTLQRNTFWIFTKDMSDADLLTILNDIPDDVELSEFAKLFADRLYEISKKFESDYISRNRASYHLNLNGLHPRFLRWDDVRADWSQDTESEEIVITVSDTESKEEKKPEKPKMSYSHYNKLIQTTYKNNEKFRKAFEATIDKFLKNKRANIENQVARIAKICPKLKKYCDNPLMLARICSRNYLFEEAPFIIPMLSFDYKAILYPGKITPALKAVQDLQNFDISWVNIIQQVIIEEKRNDELRGSSRPIPICRTSSAREIFSRLNITPTAPSSNPMPLSRSTSPLGTFFKGRSASEHKEQTYLSPPQVDLSPLSGYQSSASNASELSLSNSPVHSAAIAPVSSSELANSKVRLTEENVAAFSETVNMPKVFNR